MKRKYYSMKDTLKKFERSNKRINKRMLQVLKHFFKKDDADTLNEALRHFKDLMDFTQWLYIDTDSVRRKPKKWHNVKKQINAYYGARAQGKGVNNG